MNAHTAHDEAMFDTDAEAALLGTLMSSDNANDAYAYVSSLLEPRHFYATPHKLIYESIQALHADGKAVTPITLKGHLPEDIHAGEKTAAAYLMDLFSSPAPLFAARDHADTILEMSARRSMQEMAATAADLARARGQGVMQSLSTLDDHLSEIRGTLMANEIPMDMSAAVQSANRRANGKQGQHEQSIPLPFPSMAKILEDDMEAGGFYGLLGASQEGKTSLVLPIMRTAAENGHPTVLLSFDQSSIKCLDQMCSQSLRIEARRIRRNELKDDEYRALYEERARIAELPLSVIQCSSGKLSDVAKVGRAFLDQKRRKWLKTPLVVIDHIGSLEAPDPRADAGTKNFAKADYFLKFAKRHQCVVLMLLQRNSVNYQYIDKRPPRPTKRDIEGGEAARRPFDAIIGLFRPSFWRDEALKTVPDSADKVRDQIEAVYGDCDGIMELSMIKARYGSDRNRCRLKFEDVYTRVSEIQKREEGLPF